MAHAILLTCVRLQRGELQLLHLQEEHRIAYVGMTRARQHLYLTCLMWPPNNKKQRFLPASFVARLKDSPHCMTR